MKATKGAVTIIYGREFVEAVFENHGTFRTTTRAFEMAKQITKQHAAGRAASIYEGRHNVGVNCAGYWAQYPTDAVRVLIADCQDFAAVAARQEVK